MFLRLFSLMTAFTQIIGGNCLHNFFNLLIDIKEIYQPFQVIAYTCLSRDEMVEAYQGLPFQTQFAKIGNIPASLENFAEMHYILFVAELQCDGSIEFLEDRLTKSYFRQPYRWIIFGKNQREIPEIEALIDSIVLFVDADYQMWNFYRIRPNFPYIFEYFGNWNQSGLHVAQDILTISRRRKNLQKASITAALVIINPESLHHLEDYHDKHVDSITKKDFIICKILVDSVNGTFIYNQSDSWGYYNPDTKSWNGVIGEMVAGRSDLGGTSMFLQAQRVEVVDYVSMVTPTRVCFIFREPPLSSVSNIYLLPFTSLVWFTSGIMVVFSIVLIYIMLRIRKDSFEMDHSKNLYSRFSDCFLVAVSAIAQMGLMLQPKSVSSRIISIFFLIALLFLYTSYTANIVALLQSTAKTIVTLKDLLNSNLEVALDENPYNRYFFSTATERIRKKIYETKVLSAKSGSFLNSSTGIELVRQGSFAFHAELSVAYELMEKTYLEHEKCNLQTIQYIQVTDPWFALKKNSPFREIFKVRLFQIREYGIQQREHAKVYTKQPACTANGQNFGSVRLQECYGAFMILTAGFGIAFILFIIEKYWNNSQNCLF